MLAKFFDFTKINKLIWTLAITIAVYLIIQWTAINFLYSNNIQLFIYVIPLLFVLAATIITLFKAEYKYISISLLVVWPLYAGWQLYQRIILFRANSLSGFEVLTLLGNDVASIILFFTIAIGIGVLSKPLIKMYWIYSNKASNNKTSGVYGTAQFATTNDLKKMGAYNSEGELFGQDDNEKPLRYKMCFRLVVSPTGGGKDVNVVVPALLTQDRPIFDFDPKGENFAVTARHRAFGFGRKRLVIALDPFKTLADPEYQRGRPAELFQEWTINILDFLRLDEFERDRDINALVTALVIPESFEGKGKSHWDEYGEVIMAGLLDYLLQKADELELPRTLPTLHDLLASSKNVLDALLNEMSAMGGAAAIAANMINAAGTDERGSMITTAYRQLKWVNDANMRRILEKTNFDISLFAKGDMDIFVIIPEDQIPSHQRFFRLVFTCLVNWLRRLPIKARPKKEVLYILNELGQLDYCKPVEDAMTIIRGRGGIIWSIFQSRDQIKIYKKPKVFESCELKQFFCIDDDDSMRWINYLAGKNTIVQQSYSTSEGSSTRDTDFMNGTKSDNKSVSNQETGVDLIPPNKIRELPYEKQFVFIRGQKVIECNKINYLKHKMFQGLYDPNPLEAHKN